MAAVKLAPALVLKPLDGANYPTWRERMKARFIKAGLWSAIETSPSGVEKTTASQDPDLDLKALAELTEHVEDFLLVDIAECNTAREAWEMLENKFRGRSNQNKLHLRQKLHSLTLEYDETLVQYAARAVSYWKELCAIDPKNGLTETDIVWYILTGLPDEFESVKTHLTLSNEELSLEELLSKLSLIKKGLDDKNAEPRVTYPGMAQPQLMTRTGKAPGGGMRAGKAGAGSGSNSKSPVCWLCEQPGHVKAECPKLGAFQAWKASQGIGKHAPIAFNF